MKRKLTPQEIAEAQLIFADQLDYQRINIHENIKWPNWIGVAGSFLQGRPAPSANAVCLGWHVYFPRVLHTRPHEINLQDMAWLLHELTHTWQYQQRGPVTILSALHIHLFSRSNPYDYGGEQGLRAAIHTRRTWADFNIEQQADIVRDYYLRVRQARDIHAWEPFIKEISRIPLS